MEVRSQRSFGHAPSMPSPQPVGGATCASRRRSAAVAGVEAGSVAGVAGFAGVLVVVRRWLATGGTGRRAGWAACRGTGGFAGVVRMTSGHTVHLFVGEDRHGATPEVQRPDSVRFLLRRRRFSGWSLRLLHGSAPPSAAKRRVGRWSPRPDISSIVGFNPECQCLVRANGLAFFH